MKEYKGINGIILDVLKSMALMEYESIKGIVWNYFGRWFSLFVQLLKSMALMEFKGINRIVWNYFRRWFSLFVQCKYGLKMDMNDLKIMGFLGQCFYMKMSICSLLTWSCCPDALKILGYLSYKFDHVIFEYYYVETFSIVACHVPEACFGHFFLKLTWFFM